MRKIILLKLLFVFTLFTGFAQTKPPLGTTANFTVLAGSYITNVGNTVIYDNVGVWPGNILSGFPSGVVNGSSSLGNATAQTAQTDLTTAYNFAGAQTATNNLSGQNLGGKTLLPGVYKFNGNADLTGTLTLDANGDANAVFIFQIAADLTTGPNSVVSMRQGTRSPNIFWVVGGSVNMAAGTNFKGTIMANQNIKLGNGTILQGRLLARNGYVDLNNNPLTIPPPRFNSDIAIEKKQSGGPYFVGSQVLYKVVVKNLGPNDETNLLVSDKLPAGLTYVSSQTTNNASYNPATGYWSVDALANGKTDTLTITATITAPNFITNTATVAGDGIDLNQTNNASSVTLCAATSKPGVISGPPVLCIGTTGNTYSISSVPGAASYTWSVPTGWTITSGQGTTSINLLPGQDTASAIISVTATNTCGESAPSTKKILAIPPPPNILPSISGNPYPCQNSTGNIYSIPPQNAGTTYTWTVPQGWTITAGLGTNSITVTAGTKSGNITLVASNDCGTSTPKSLNVVPATGAPLNPGPITPPFAGNPCAGQTSLTYSIPGAANTSVYTWTVPAGWFIVSGQGTSSIVVTAGSTNGTISVVGSNGCGTSPASTLTVNPTSAPPVSAGPITGEHIPCIGQTSVTYSVPAQAGTYNWNVPSGWTITSGQGTNSINVSIGTAAAPGSVSVTVSNGCGSSTASTVPVTPSTTTPPTPGSILGNPSGSPCVGQTNLTYTIVPVNAASIYDWTVPAGWTITGGQGSAVITVSAGSTPGTISVVARNGCGSSTASILAQTPTATPPPAPISIAGDSIPCAGSSNIMYTIGFVNSAIAYNWSVPSGWTISSGQGTTSITVAAGSTNGVIRVTAINACGPSSVTQLHVTAATSVPLAPGAITGILNPCVNQKSVIYSIAPVAGASGYTWTVPGGWVIASGQGTTTITVNTGTTSGSIAVAATNGCGSGRVQTLAINLVTNSPDAAGSISGNVVPCTGQLNTAYSIASVPRANSYTWTVPNGWTITSGQGTNSILVTTSGTSGTITVSAENNCGSGVKSSLAVNPTSITAPSAGTISGDIVPCKGQTNLTYSIANVASASSYTWTVPSGWTIVSGQNTTSITVSAGTSVGTVSVTAANGCGTGVASTLSVSPASAPPVAPDKIFGSNVLCLSGGTQTYSVSPVANASSYTWTIPAAWTIINGLGTNSITVNQPQGTGAGVVSVIASNGCGSSSPTSLNVIVTSLLPPKPGPITTSFNGSPCAGQTDLKYYIKPVPVASSYIWTLPAGWTITSGLGTDSITVTAGSQDGIISVVAENSCGSGAASTLATTVTVGPPPTSGAIFGTIAPCIGNYNTTYNLDPVTGASKYTWSVPTGWIISTGQGTNTITVIPGSTPGQVSVIASNSCGAASPSVLNVTPSNSAPPVAGSISGNNLVCANERYLKYSVVAVSGANTYNWVVPADWDIISGQGTTEIVVNGGIIEGDVTVKAENDCGTSSAVAFPVSIRPLLQLSGAIKDESSPCTGLRYSITPIPGATSYEWILPEGWVIFSGASTNSIQVIASTDTGTISVQAQNLGCRSFPLKVFAKASMSNIPLDIPNAFSPNGDGLNDYWEVTNMENYPDNELIIVNRWGNEVYRQKGYNNAWNGGGLSEGTYYYILRVKQCNDQQKTFKGFVMIAR